MAAPNECLSEILEIRPRTRKSMILTQKAVREIDDSDYLNGFYISKSGHRPADLNYFFLRDEMVFCSLVKKSISLGNSLFSYILVFSIFVFKIIAFYEVSFCSF